LTAASRVSLRASALNDAGTVITSGAWRGSRAGLKVLASSRRRSRIRDVTSAGVRQPGTRDREYTRNVPRSDFTEEK
jgi:hypothetical protein